MSEFVGIGVGREPAPDETTVCTFLNLLEVHDLERRLFREVHRYLEKHGFKISTGTIIGTRIINSPSSTKNAEQQRDPDMYQTKKGCHDTSE